MPAESVAEGQLKRQLTAQERYAQGILDYLKEHQAFEDGLIEHDQHGTYFRGSLHTFCAEMFPASQPAKVVNDVMLHLGAITKTAVRGRWMINRWSLFENPDGTPVEIPDRSTSFGHDSRTTRIEDAVRVLNKRITTLEETVEGLVRIVTGAAAASEVTEHLAAVKNLKRPTAADLLQPDEVPTEDQIKEMFGIDE